MSDRAERMLPFRDSLARTTLVLALGASLALPPPLAHAADKLSVLGLEGADKAAASRLTDSLRAEFGTRGYGATSKMSLFELRFSSGCDEGDDVCITNAGRNLGAKAIVYGTVTPTPSGYLVTLRHVDTASGEVRASLERNVKKSELSSEEVAATAVGLTDELLGVRKDTTPAAIPVTDEPTGATQPATEGPTDNDTAEGPEAADTSRSGKKGKLIWGKDPSPPAWKWAGLGVSAGLTVVAASAALGTGLSARKGGPVYDDLVSEANASLTDAFTGNEVDPNGSGDLCTAAREDVDGNPGGVRNVAMADTCTRGEKLAVTSTAMWAVTGVMAVSTIVFTTLLFVRRDRAVSARLRHHGVRVGAAPSPGGAVVGAGFRF